MEERENQCDERYMAMRNETNQIQIVLYTIVTVKCVVEIVFNALVNCAVMINTEINEL